MRRAAAATITQPAGPDGWTDGRTDGWMAVQPGNSRACRQGQAVPHAPRRRSRGFETVQAEHLSEDHYSWNPNSLLPLQTVIAHMRKLRICMTDTTDPIPAETGLRSQDLP